MSAKRKSSKSPEEMVQDARNMLLKSYEQLGESGGTKSKRAAAVLPPYDIVWEVIDRLHRALSLLEAVPLPDEPDLDEDDDNLEIYDDYDYDEEDEGEDEEDEDQEEEEEVEEQEDEEEDEEDEEEDKKSRKKKD